jgi:hypothetical protein
MAGISPQSYRSQFNIGTSWLPTHRSPPDSSERPEPSENPSVTEVPIYSLETCQYLSTARRRILAVLFIHTIATCVSMAYVAQHYPHLMPVSEALLKTAILSAGSFAFVGIIFAVARFSFGYFLGFYFFTIIEGYLWIVNFSTLSYDHRLATISIFLSGLAFLIPATLVNSPSNRHVSLSPRAFNAVLTGLLICATATVLTGAFYNFRLVGLSSIYQFRNSIEFPTALRYAIGITSGAVLPYAFACFVTLRAPWRAALTLLLFLLLYPVTLTKLTLFAPGWLLFVLLLTKLTEIRIATVLSLLAPMLVGIALALLNKFLAISLPLTGIFIGAVNDRMIAMPSIALDVYNNFFSTHELTDFCQINLLKPFVDCPYSDPISVVMDRTYPYGAFNASMFATEGIASVGLFLAPLSAFACGTIVWLGNRLSSDLPARFVFLSAGILPQIFLNVPLTTTLLTNGGAVLFLLWYITPRAMSSPTYSSKNQPSEKLD